MRLRRGGSETRAPESARDAVAGAVAVRPFPYGVALAWVLAAGAAVRCGYVWIQPATDPGFSFPYLDGAYYLDRAREIAAGSPGLAGAYYLAPLYPWVLAALLGVAGGNLAFVFGVQQMMIVASAGLFAVVARRRGGDLAGLVAAALVLLHQPGLYFASRPLGEPLAILLLAGSLACGTATPRRTLGSGLASGLASLVRPNLLLVPVLWAVVLLVRVRRRAALVLVVGAALAIAPVAMRNAARSGHLVPISSNAGITFAQGNAPGAVGVHARIPGFSGRIDTQRDEATAIASLHSGRELDEVEADRWWGRWALAARIHDPRATFELVGRRIVLLLADPEVGLDYASSIDSNPLRHLAPVPFAGLLGLAVAAWVGLGWSRATGRGVTAAIVACVATPLLFYVSGRYRLPLAMVLCVPAGVAATLPFRGEVSTRRRVLAFAAGAAVAAGSMLVPVADRVRPSQAASLANRASAWERSGRYERAIADLERALTLDPTSSISWYNLGVVRDRQGRTEEAIEAYRTTLRLEPDHVEAAVNLSANLIRGGRYAEAIPLLRSAATVRPSHAATWANLIVALASAGDLAGARDTARAASRAGVELDPGLVEAIGTAAEDAERRRPETDP